MGLSPILHEITSEQQASSIAANGPIPKRKEHGAKRTGKKRSENALRLAIGEKLLRLRISPAPMQ